MTVRARWSAGLAAVAVLAASPSSHRSSQAEDAPPPSATKATEATDVTVDTTWSGEIRLSRRVTVRGRATLSIAPGTRVVIPWSEPVAGTTTPRPGLEVEGALVAEGDAAAPIRFEPEPPPEGVHEPKRPRWLGLVVHGERRETVRLSHCLVVGAETGLQPGASDATATDCVFVRCGVGVGVGILWESRQVLIRFVGDATPRLSRCRFGGCDVGVCVERHARPALSRCLFDRCRHGVANDRPGISYSVEGLGPTIDRCEFLRCGTAVNGPSRVTNSIFERNERVFSGSDFGEVSLTSIERFVRARNLYWQNDALVTSDVPIGADAIVSDPRRRGVFPEPLSIDELLGPLETRLALAPGSPGLSTATDGGDLGAFGDAGVEPAGTAPTRLGTGLAVDAWLILGPDVITAPDAIAALATDAVKRPRVAGDVDAGGQWAALDVGALADPKASRALAAALPGPRLLAASFASESAGAAALRLAWDGTLAAWWNGVPVVLPVVLPTMPRRYASNGPSATIARRSGTNVLVVLHTPRTTTGRLAAEIVDPTNGVAPAGFSLAPLDRVDAKATKPPLASASSTVEKGADGKPTGRGLVRVTLASAVHWRDASDRRRYALVDASGRALDLAGAEVRYRPSDRAIVLRLARPLAAGAWSLSISGLRRPSGDPLPEASARVGFRVP